MKHILSIALVLISACVAYGNEEIEMALPGGESMTFVWIEPGTFVMGSPLSGEASPQHEVTISRGFWLGKYEITQRQWQAVMGENPSHYTGADHPVETVTWFDIQAFIGNLNRAAADSLYRLPSEAEWEYASRAGTQTTWSFGQDEEALADYAWYADNNRIDGDYPLGTKPIGLKEPNAWGLYDMYGNVCEWCQNAYEAYAEEAQLDPMGPETGLSYPYRGGHFYGNALMVQSAFRSSNGPSGRDPWLGARLLMIEPIATSAPTDSWGHIKVDAR